MFVQNFTTIHPTVEMRVSMVDLPAEIAICKRTLSLDTGEQCPKSPPIYYMVCSPFCSGKPVHHIVHSNL